MGNRCFWKIVSRNSFYLVEVINYNVIGIYMKSSIKYSDTPPPPKKERKETRTTHYFRTDRDALVIIYKKNLKRVTGILIHVQVAEIYSCFD